MTWGYSVQQHQEPRWGPSQAPGDTATGDRNVGRGCWERRGHERGGAKCLLFVLRASRSAPGVVLLPAG